MAGNMVAPFVPALAQSFTSLEAAGIDNCRQKLNARGPTLWKSAAWMRRRMMLYEVLGPIES